ncbi:MAG TPA: S-adenosylmethionine:tRNA ribosyltransferase-isomerase, partial [Pseudomonadales bacterium]|nr:S-adenosylmethionine:tRNA ribosyltransferase-isomerase [Pseudomonadales bacterium]
MKTSDFNFDLPNELIARFPLAQRSSSRLLSLHKQTGEVSHGHFRDLLAFFNAGDLIVFNNTKVIPARLYGAKLSGGKLEALIERVTGEHEALAHIRSSRSPKPGSRILLEGVEVE